MTWKDVAVLNDLAGFWEKGDIFPPKIVQGDLVPFLASREMFDEGLAAGPCQLNR